MKMGTDLNCYRFKMSESFNYSACQCRFTTVTAGTGNNEEVMMMLSGQVAIVISRTKLRRQNQEDKRQKVKN